MDGKETRGKIGTRGGKLLEGKKGSSPAKGRNERDRTKSKVMKTEGTTAPEGGGGKRAEEAKD